ncbi:MAG: hypothetical protein JO069_20560 [Verrucomicrobia bacterium]|nr:hypothetical protein [Verrucomicrobiota bacterium]
MDAPGWSGRLHGEELCSLRVRHLQSRQGVPHLRVFGKGSNIRHVPAHPLVLQRIHAYLEAPAMVRMRMGRSSGP